MSTPRGAESQGEAAAGQPQSAVARAVILFDWDGTLINSLDLKVRHAGLLFNQEYGVSPAEVEAAYRRHSGIPRQQLFAAIFQELQLGTLQDDDFARLSARFSEMNRRAFTDPGTPGLLPPDTLPTLEQLRRMGAILYVSSSAATAELREIAQSLGLAQTFLDSGGEILGSQPGLNKGPEHVRYVLHRHMAPYARLAEPLTLLAVGDEPADIRLARQAGVTAVAKAGTYPLSFWQQATPAPDFLIQTLSELPGILSAILNGGARMAAPEWRRLIGGA